MTDFMIRFLICNIIFSSIIGLLLSIKKIFKSIFTSRTSYNLWIMMFVLLIIPLIPFQFVYIQNPLFDFLNILSSTKSIETSEGTIYAGTNHFSGLINDFTISVSRQTSPKLSYVLLIIWLSGILAMILLTANSFMKLHRIKKSALPLQNKAVQALYNKCLSTLGIKKYIPIYSTAFIRGPIMTGLCKPAVYLPIHLISDYNETEMYHMLLHELIHYKHKDAISNHCMNLIKILYWFNPFIWIMIKEIRIDREIACDSSVLMFLGPDSSTAYGNTLIDFAEKVSFTPFPFAANLGGTKKQMKRRINNINSYKVPTLQNKIMSCTAFILIAIILFSTVPALSSYANNNNHYIWHTSGKKIASVDYSSYFDNYDGSFVLYDVSSDEWIIYNIENATTRFSPNSTYKIYSALFGLNDNIISTNSSYMSWDNTNYPFTEWKMDQTLDSAMEYSVNWYFQTIDSKIGTKKLSKYLHQIHYGNEKIDQNISSFWMESSLKISPVEQVELLTKLSQDDLDFSVHDMDAVKDSIHIASSPYGEIYGKTGTGRVNENDINGWFIGYIASNNNTYIFATNIQADCNATGSIASKITLSILSDMNLWK